MERNIRIFNIFYYQKFLAEFSIKHIYNFAVFATQYS